MKVLIEILDEHEKNIEDLKRLPKIGEVIEISERDTSHKRGAQKGTVRKFRVVECIDQQKMFVTKHLDYEYTECFSYSDLLFDDFISWNRAE